jgi:nucleotide-binding universal stress UspA family protein
MLSTILVPLDGSPLAESALPIASALARRCAASLALVRAAYYDSQLSDVAGDHYRAVGEAEAYLNQLLERLTAQGLSVSAEVPYGDARPADWILSESVSRDAALVIMATHDREGVDRLLHRGVGLAVVQASKAPVMLVHSSDPVLAQRFEAEHPVLAVPLDGSDLSESVLPAATSLAQAIQGELLLVTVAGSGSEQDAASAYLDGVCQRIQPSVTRATGVVRAGDPAHEIAATADEYGAAAVIMATHGRTGLARLALGSVAEGVLHHSTVPAILLRPEALPQVAR